jgi:catechol 2,3-dioxygenase-like lactoylglutathione lyase family enzyme
MSELNLRPEGLGYVAMNTTDMEDSIKFWTTGCQLEISDRNETTTWLRGGMSHHWIVLHQAEERGLARVGLEVANPDVLNAMADRLEAGGIEVERGDGLDSDYVLHYARFNDTSGNPLELYCDMVTMPSPPVPINVEIMTIQHCVLGQSDTKAAHEFYTKYIGLRVSDWIGEGLFFGHFKDGWHHGLGIGAMGPQKQGLNHICFQPPGLDDVMRARARAMKMGYPITMDILRHAPSTSIGFYFAGPDTVAEFSYGARHFTEDNPPVPRRLPLRETTMDMWQDGVEADEISMAERLKSLGGDKN